jgi:hypothetical protein
MKTLCLTLGLVSLAFCLGCGSGSNNSRGTPGPFSDSSLLGQYVYQLTGTDLINGVPFREEGVFIADGAGHITGGEDDFVKGAVGPVLTAVTGSYTISGDGTANATLNFSDGNAITLGMTVVSTSKVYFIEADTFATGAGVAEKQNTAALAAVPSGTFAFRIHTTDGAPGSAGSTASVGVFTVAGGVVTSGSEDVSDGGVASSRTITSGLLNTPDATGRGTGSLTDSSPVTTSFVYYVVDSSNIRFLSSDLGILGLGRAEKQAAGPFDATSLSGNYAFGGNGDTALNVGGLRAVGQVMADGGGHIPSGAVDAAKDGSTVSDVTVTGGYAVNGVTGRVGVNLTGGVITNEVLYLVNSSRAFFLITDPGIVADGTVDLQSSNSFTNASINGTFGFLMDGFNSSFFIDRVATLKWDGAGKLTLNELVNASGIVNNPQPPLTGTYKVSNNGRTAGTINSLSNNMVFYLVSGSKAYVLQNDAATEIDGATEVQVAP